jgi:hypothetical protein
MAAHKLEPTITEQLESQLQPFIDECERRGYPITDVQLVESIPGVYNSFALEFIADWAKDMGRIEAMHIIRTVLHETTPEDVHQFIYGIVPDFSPRILEQIRAENKIARTA